MPQQDPPSRLVVGILTLEPYWFDCSKRITCDRRGLAVDVAVFLCQQLKMQCEFRKRSGLDFGTRQSNGSWIGAVGDVHDGLTDTYLPMFTPIAQRLEAVQFSRVFLEDSPVLLTRMPDQSDMVSENVLRSFQPSVWAALTVGYAVMLLLELVSARINHPEPCRRTDSSVRVYRLSCTDKLIFCLQSLVSLIVITLLGGVTVSRGVANAGHLPFVDLRTFADCLQLGRCRLAASSPTQSYLQALTHPDNPLSEVIQRSLAVHPLVIVQNEEMIQSISNTKQVYLTMMLASRRADYVRLMHRTDQQFLVVDVELPNAGAFPLRHQSPLRAAIDEISYRFTEFGFYQRFIRLYGEGLFPREEQRRQMALTLPQPLTLHSMLNVFVVLIAGCTAATAAFIVERSLTGDQLYRLCHPFYRRNG